MSTYQGKRNHSNNQQHNMALHNAAADAAAGFSDVEANIDNHVGRGMSTDGKIVFRPWTATPTDAEGIIEYCVKTTPDPTLPGGGTWRQLGKWYQWFGGAGAIGIETDEFGFQSTGTAPVLGAGSSAVMKYCIVGNLVIAHFFIDFTGTGAATGTGTYRLKLPVTPSGVGGNLHIGQGTISNYANNDLLPIKIRTSGTNKYALMHQIGAGLGGAAVTATSPIVPFSAGIAQGDYQGSFAYAISNGTYPPV